jgi:hypothetical protein
MELTSLLFRFFAYITYHPRRVLFYSSVILHDNKTECAPKSEVSLENKNDLFMGFILRQFLCLENCKRNNNHQYVNRNNAKTSSLLIPSITSNKNPFPSHPIRSYPDDSTSPLKSNLSLPQNEFFIKNHFHSRSLLISKGFLSLSHTYTHTHPQC